MRKRRAYAGEEFAARDLWVVGILIALLLLGVRSTVFFDAAIAYVIALATYWLIRYLERRRAERANTAPSWTERLGDGKHD